MSLPRMLCFYYPTTTVLVDDNQPFLEVLSESLNKKKISQAFHSPLEALNFIEKYPCPSPEDFLGKSREELTGISLNVDIRKIRQQVENKDRFKIPTVVIVDYDMPEMSGVEFCKKLVHHPIKKIMLTGAGDDKLAIRAFNEGIIQKFIPKDDPHVMQTLNNAIQALQEEYFASLSELMIKNITAITFSFLKNEKFKKFLSDFIQSHHIVEFYLVDPVGSFFMLDQQGNMIWLAVQSHQEMGRSYEIAKDYEASRAIIDALEKKEKLLCFFSDEDFEQPTKNWKKFLHEARKIPGIENGYYAVIMKEKIS